MCQIFSIILLQLAATTLSITYRLPVILQFILPTTEKLQYYFFSMKFALFLLFAVAGMHRVVDAFAPSAPIAAGTNLVVSTGRICANANLRTITNSCLAMSAGGLPDFDVNNIDQTEAVAMTKKLSDTVITSLSSTGVTLPTLDSIDLSALSSLSLGEGISTDEVSSKVNEALDEFIAWAQPQVEALTDYGMLCCVRYCCIKCCNIYL